MINWKKEQLIAIEEINKDVLVSASAGTGKTAVLIERASRMILDKRISVSKLLILTFTEKAASELKTRLEENLKSALSQTDDSDFKEYIESQINKIQISDVSTIHAFCKRVISENFYVINQDPALEIIDQSEISKLQKKAFKNCYDRIKFYSKYSDVLIALSKNINKEKLEDTIIEMNSLYSSLSNPSGKIEESIEYLSEKIENFDELDFVVAFKMRLNKILSSKLSLIDEILAMLENSLKHEEKIASLISLFKKDKELLNLLCDNVNDFDFKANIKFPRYPSISKEIKAEAVIDYELLKSNRDSYKNIINDNFENLYFFRKEDHKKNYEIAREQAKDFLYVLKIFREEFTKVKLENLSLDFDDLQEKAAIILQSPEINKKYRERFEYIFIDEYQDTSQQQEEIINLIKRDDRLFMVGDYKQSIYSFRNTDPKYFLEKYKEFLSSKGEKTLVKLNENFRTHPDILNFTNSVFFKLMTENFGGLDYKNEASLISGRDDFKLSAKPVINMMYSKEVDELDEELMYEDKFSIKLYPLVLRVKKLLTREIYDTKEKKNRKIKLSDISILMRSPNKDSKKMKRFFAKYGIDLNINTEENLLEIYSVKLIIDFLIICDNPLNDKEVLSVMRSFLFEFEDEELLEFAKDSKVYMWHRIKDYISINKDSRLSKKLYEFVLEVENFRKKAHIPLAKRLDKLIRVKDLNAMLKTMDLENIEVNALNSFVEYLYKFSEKNESSLSFFVKHIKEMISSSSEIMFSSPLKNTKNSVNLLSIHRSKGLEFPVVILFELEKNFNSRSGNSNMIYSKENALSMQTFNIDLWYRIKHLQYLHVENIEKFQQKLEEIRIFYVAMTRAVYHFELFLSFDSKENKGKSQNYQELKSYGEWLDNIFALESMAQDINFDEEIENDVFISRKINIEDEIEKLKSISEKKEIDFEFTNFEEEFDFKVKNLKQRAGVSTLLEKLNKEERPPSIKFYASRAYSKSDALKKGNAYHKFMEHYIDSSMSLEKFWNFALSKNLLKKEELEFIDIKKLEEFENSNLKKRIDKAEIIWKEKEFIYNTKIEDDEYMLQGVIDLAFVEKGEIVLLDYKTDRDFRKSTMVERYKFQIDSYSAALESLTGLKVKERYIYSFEGGSIIDI